jgi:hypothetical protein
VSRTLLQKAFVVSVGNTFMVLVRGTDTICTIQKINYLLYRLERTDMKNQFSKIKKISFCRRPDPRQGSGRGRRRPRQDPAEGGGGARPRGRRGGEGGHRWAPLGLVVAEVGKEGVGGRRSWSWSPRWEGGCRWAPLILVVAEVGKEGVSGSRSSSWLPRWGRRVSVGAARPRGRRGGEGGHRWEPLILMVAEVGKEGIGGRPSWSWSPRWGRRASVGTPRGR